MLLLLKLARRNLVGAGIRTWLNVAVTSLSFVLIIFMSGLYQGLLDYSIRVTIDSEAGGGIYQHPVYDLEDPFTLDDSHGVPPEVITGQIESGRAMAVLLVMGAAYTEGRMVPAQLRGIDPNQSIVDLPTERLATYRGPSVPVLIGTGMARLIGSEEGDLLIVRWQDADGSYDAIEVEIVELMEVENFKVDLGIFWLPLETLRNMASMPGESTYITVAQGEPLLSAAAPWRIVTPRELIADMVALVEAKQGSANILYFFLLTLAAMGIFNSQVLAIFQRRREIGTLMALGMHRARVVVLFTLEGGIHAIFALLLATLYGSPLLYLTAKNGIGMPTDYSDSGFIIGARLFPTYGPAMILGTIVLVAAIVTVVSYLPSRKIAKMEPTETLRGKYA